MFAGWVHMHIQDVVCVCERKGKTVRRRYRQLPVRFKGSRWCLLPPPECCLAPGDTLLFSARALLFIPVTNTTLLLALKRQSAEPNRRLSENLKTTLGFSSRVSKLRASYLSLMKEIFASGELVMLLSFDSCGMILQHYEESYFLHKINIAGSKVRAWVRGITINISS